MSIAGHRQTLRTSLRYQRTNPGCETLKLLCTKIAVTRHEDHESTGPRTCAGLLRVLMAESSRRLSQFRGTLQTYEQ